MWDGCNRNRNYARSKLTSCCGNGSDVSHRRYIQLYSPECTLAENININNNRQNKDRNILINTVQLNIRYTFGRTFVVLRNRISAYFSADTGSTHGLFWKPPTRYTWETGPLLNAWFLCPTQVCPSNVILIGSTTPARLTGVPCTQADRQTTSCVAIGRICAMRTNNNWNCCQARVEIEIFVITVLIVRI